jgi:hypothetical protein
MMSPTSAYDEKVDVFSFGILMWCCWKRTLPYPDWTKAEMIQYVKARRRPPSSNSAPGWFNTLMWKCWRQEPEARPSFTEILVMGPTMLKRTPHLRGQPHVHVASCACIHHPRPAAGQGVCRSCFTDGQPTTVPRFARLKALLHTCVPIAPTKGKPLFNFVPASVSHFVLLSL